MTKFLHTCVRVKDLEASLKFYKEALGFKEARRNDFPEYKFTLVKSSILLFCDSAINFATFLDALNSSFLYFFSIANAYDLPTHCFISPKSPNKTPKLALSSSLS